MAYDSASLLNTFSNSPPGNSKKRASLPRPSPALSGAADRDSKWETSSG